MSLCELPVNTALDLLSVNPASSWLVTSAEWNPRITKKFSHNSFFFLKIPLSLNRSKTNINIWTRLEEYTVCFSKFAWKTGTQLASWRKLDWQDLCIFLTNTQSTCANKSQGFFCDRQHALLAYFVKYTKIWNSKSLLGSLLAAWRPNGNNISCRCVKLCNKSKRLASRQLTTTRDSIW